MYYPLLAMMKRLKFYEKAIAIDENAAAAYYSAGNLFYNREDLNKQKYV